MVIPSPRSRRINAFSGKGESSFSLQKNKSKIIFKLKQCMNLTCKGYWSYMIPASFNFIYPCKYELILAEQRDSLCFHLSL